MDPAIRSAFSTMVAPAAAVLLVSGCAFVITRTTGDLIPINGGFGWDGNRYGRMAQDLIGERLGTYHLQRILPAIGMYSVFRLFDISTTRENIVLAFQIYSLLLTAVSLVAWLTVARYFVLGRVGIWVGCIGLFFNFFGLKMAYYYPLLTDMTAFTFGLASLALYLYGKRLWLLAVALAASLTWPTLGISCAVLLLLPANPAAPTVETTRGFAWLGVLLAAATSLVLATRFVSLYSSGTRQVGMGPVAAIDENLVVLSLIAHTGFVLVAFALLFRCLTPRRVVEGLKAVRVGNAALALAALVVPPLVVAAMAAGFDSTRRSGLSYLSFFDFVAFLPVLRPFLTPLSHFVYFGPIVILLIIYWGRISRLIDSLGLGLLLFVALNLLIALSPESRQSAPGFAVLVAFAAVVVDRLSWSWQALLGFAGLSLFWSRVWLPINQGSGEGVVFADRYFMNHGPYMGPDAYWIFLLALLVVTGGFLLFALRQDAQRRQAFDR